MENDFVFLLSIFVGLVLIVLLFIAIIRYFTEYTENVRFVKMELGRAFEDESYFYWKRELRLLRLSLIPGLTPKCIKKIMRRFERLGGKRKKNADRLSSMLLPSFVGICICAIALTGGTYAWYTASSTLPSQTISSAEYSISAVVKEGIDEISAENDIYRLKAGESYTVTLSADGNATTGYCRILLIGNRTLLTEQFPTKASPDRKSISFTIALDSDSDMKIIAEWGTSTVQSGKIGDGDTVNVKSSSETEEQMQ